MSVKFRNKSTIPQGMLAPSGILLQPVNPAVQATTRPPGTILQPSPGYDSVRTGKNIFQGKGPAGGFRPTHFAEEIGGTGAAISVTPGDPSSVPSDPGSEMLPVARDSIVIADRQLNPGWATKLHGGQMTIPDMGDRSDSRPRSKSTWAALNPVSYLSAEYKKSPLVAVGMGGALVYVVYLVAGEVERKFSPRRVASDGASLSESGARDAGEVSSDVIRKIGDAGDDAVKAIREATEKAVDTVKSTAKTVTD